MSGYEFKCHPHPVVGCRTLYVCDRIGILCDEIERRASVGYRNRRCRLAREEFKQLVCRAPIEATRRWYRQRGADDLTVQQNLDRSALVEFGGATQRP